MLQNILTIIQVILAVLLVAVIMLQQKGAGIGEAFGGSSGMFSTRRGVDLILHRVTIVVSILFFAIAIALLIV